MAQMQVGPIRPLTDAEKHEARLAIAGRAENTADARLIMRALGLIEKENEK